MSAPPDRRDSADSPWWLVVVAMAAAWPIVNLLHNNWSMLIASDLGRAAMWWAVFLAVTSAAVLLARRLFKRVSLAQFAIAASLGLVLFFLFEWSVPHVASLLDGVGLPRRAAIPVYVVSSILIALAGLRFARRAPGRRILAAFVIVGAAMGVVALASDVVRTGLPFRAAEAARPLAAPGTPVAHRPNVFLVVLDGYGRSDVLLRVAAFDNGAFLATLSERGFTTVAKSVANYPMTYLSVSSLLAGDYPALPEAPPYTTRGAFYDVIQGNNPWVASFRAMGYRYLHSGNVWGGSACGGHEDLCLNSRENVPTREIDLSILQMTPLRLFLPGVVTTTERGNLEFIARELDSIYRHAPFFLFAHTMPPHPPFERAADCSEKERLASLEWWSYPHEYRDNTLCVNRQLVSLVDKVLARDPTAVMIFLSDHGSGFTKPFVGPLDQWTDEMIAERFPSLLTIRAPERCRPSLPDDLSNVNVGRYIVACIAGARPQYVADRFFTTADERHPGFGRVHEVTARVQALKLR